MNSIFRSYPEHPWLSEWIFEPRECGTTFREINAGYFFQTMETVGRIAPNTENMEQDEKIDSLTFVESENNDGTETLLEYKLGHMLILSKYQTFER